MALFVDKEALPDSLEAIARLRTRAAWCRQLANGAGCQRFAGKMEKLVKEFDWEADLIEAHVKS